MLDHHHQNRTAIFTALGACLILGFGPILAVLIWGYDVSMVSQTNLTGPAPAMQSAQTWSQSFLFPDRPVTGIALRPGTYGLKSNDFKSGERVIVRIAQKTSRSMLTLRQFDIELKSLKDNRWHVFRFDPIHLHALTESAILIEGDRLPTDQPVITFWRSSTDYFLDGIFKINKRQVPGDLSFKIISRVNGLDALRMIKTRWQAGRDGIWASLLLPVTAWLAWVFFCFLSVYFLLSGARR